MTHRWIWPFELIEKIGQGGMGVVYRARFVKDDRHVALKLLSEEFISDGPFLARFQREMDALKQLKHRNIVKCFGGVCESKRPFYAMELVEGGSVRRLLNERGSLSWEQAIEFTLQLCSALSYAHDRGIIHRDVKPSNLLLTKSGQLKLSDFGLVYITGATKLTRDGMTLGSLRYMPPERFHNEDPADARTDLYSMGCVLYEMISGQVPVDGETPAEILHESLKGTAQRLSALKPDCPAEIDELVTQLLQKEPKDRPATAAIVAKKLRGITNTVTVNIGSPERGVSNEPTVIKRIEPAPEDASEPHPSRSPLPAWLVWGSLLLAVVLIITNIVTFQSWSQSSLRLARSEQLWLKQYGGNDTKLRLEAANALGQMQYASDAVDAAFAEVLDNALRKEDDDKSEDQAVVMATIQAMVQLEGAAETATSKLKSLVTKHKNQNVRQLAASALKNIPDAKSRWSLWSILLVLGGLIATGAAVAIGVKKLSSPFKEGSKEAVDADSDRPVDALATQWLNNPKGRRKRSVQ